MRLHRFGVFVLFVLLAAPSATATDYYADLAGGDWQTMTWRLGSNSGPPSGTYPGANAGDRAIMDFQGISISVTGSIPNAVELQENCVSCFLTVSAGGTLPLTGSSSVSAGAILQMSGGTVNNTGTLTIATGSSINWTTGTITGAGTTMVNNGASVGAGGTSMILGAGQTLNLSGTFTYGASAGGLQIAAGAVLNVQNGGVVDIQNASGIAGTGTINVLSGGTFKKTNGNFGTNITPTLNNSGLVQVDIASLVLRGTHTGGTFTMNGAATGVAFPFGGTNQFNGTNTINGTGEAFFGCPNVINAGAVVSITNFENDGFASFSGSGTINLSGIWTWRAATVSGITINAQSGSTVNYTGEGSASLTGAAHLNNQGTLNVNSGAGTLSLFSGGHITNDGQMNIAGDLTINSDANALSRIDNLATRVIQKTTGATNAFLNLPVNNSGSVSTTSGVLKLGKGGTHTGNFFASTAGTTGIAFNGGTHQFLGTASLTGPGTYALSAGVMDVDTNLTVGPTTPFQLLAGTLTGSGAFTLQGSFLWQGGTMDNSSGSGQTVLSLNTTQLATTAPAVLSGRTLSNSGTVTYNPTAGNELAIDSAANFLNTGTFNITGDSAILSNQAGTARFTNGTGGTINKSTGAGTFTFHCYFTSSATINLSSGTITLAGGGQDLGTVNFGSAANKILISNSSFSFAAAPAINGGGAIVVSGTGSLTNLVAVTIPTLELLGGTVGGSGTLNITALLLWKQGTFNGAGTVAIANTATVDATAPTGTMAIDNGRVFTNDGTFNWNGTNQQFNITNGSTLNNNNLFVILGSGVIGGTSPANAINNSGTFRKTGGPAMGAGTRIDVRFVNNGTLSSEAGQNSLIINGGGSQGGGGSMNVNAGALLDFFGGTFTVNAGTQPFTSGGGTYRVNGGTLLIAGSMTMPAANVLQVQSGALEVAAGATFQVGLFQWTGGTLQGDGTTRLIGTSHTVGGPTTLNNNHTLTAAAGTTVYNGVSPNVLTIGGTAAFNIESSATVQMINGSAINGTSPDGLTITGGTLDVAAGTATLNSGGSMTSGAIATGTAGNLTFGAGTFTIGGGSVTGTGTITLAAGTLAVNAALTIPNFVHNNGTLTGTGALTLGDGSWNGGSATGTGTTTLAGTATYTIASGPAKTLARNLIVSGGAAVTATDLFSLSGAASITNGSGATWNDAIAGSTAIACIGCTGRFHNAAGASFVRHGTNLTQYFARFDNDGTASSAAGTNGFGLMAGGTHTGDFDSGSANLWFAGTHTFSSTSDLTGAGFINIRDSFTHQGTIVLSPLNSLTGITISLAGTTALFNTVSPVSTPKLNVNATTVGGSGGIVITRAGSLLNNFPILTGPLVVTVDAGADLRIFSVTLDGATIINNGTLFLDGSIASGVSAGAVINAGTMNAQPTTNISVAPPFTNQGAAKFLAFTVAFNGGYTQTAGTSELRVGTFSSPLTVNLNGGSVIGTGTITANISNAATLEPGLVTGPGTITIAGNYTQTSAGTIIGEIGGTTPGTNYDQVVVTGNVTLDGTMNVVLINGFTPADANVFDLVTWGGTRSGTFAAVNLPPYPIGTLNATYEPNAFRITADTVADLAITKSGPANAGVGQNVSFTIQVTNNGPGPSSGVTVNDPTPANLAFVSTSGDCTTPFPCALGTMNSGQTRTITATYTVTGGAGTNITNTATVSSPSTDNASSNNSAGATLFVDLADVSITKSGPANATLGQNISFTIAVANSGPSPAGNVVVNDPTPANLSFVSNSGDCATAFPCALGTIAAGATKTITATYTVSGGTGTNITNTASVSTSTTESTTANNSAGATVFIQPADVAITKSGPASAALGQNVAFTIAVTNDGPSPATGVVVNDPTPANMAFVSTSGDCATAFPCSLGTIASGATKNITATYTVTGGTGTSITNTASVSASTSDDNSANNTAGATVFIHPADVAITKSGPASAALGQNVAFSIAVTNNGPSPATEAVVNDPTPANMAFVSTSGDCATAFPCSLGTIASGATKTITATYTVTGGTGTSITNTASVSASTSDNTSANDSASATVFIEPSDLSIAKAGPRRADPGDEITFTITVMNGGQSPAQNVVVTDPTPAGLTFLSTGGACTTPFPCNLGSIPAGQTRTITATYSIGGSAAGSSITNTASVSTTTSDDPANNTASATVSIECLNSAPDLLRPTGTAEASGALSWRGNGTSYIVYFGPAGSGCGTKYATTSARSVSYGNLAPGTYEWRVESIEPGCRTASSDCVTFTVAEECTVPAAPLPRVVGQATSAKTYAVEWDAVTGTTRYEIEEADNPAFNRATRLSLTGTSQAFRHDVTEATAFYYRVRAFTACTQTPGPFSPTLRVVIVPLPPKEAPRKSVNVPVGSEEVVVQEVFIPGEPGQNLFFTATTDRPWLTVQPTAGVITPAGITLQVLADPKNLPNGTFTASVIVTITTPGTSPAVNGSTSTTVPISINLVTPVTPVASKPAPSQYALIIPSAGHLDGIDSQWQSDVRVTNAGFRSTRYRLTFTPSGGAAQGVKQTIITVDAGATTALDDIVSNWFGLGTLGDDSNGMLEILPLDDPATTSLTTVASSRTYNISGNGTLGQYIPAVPFPSFIGRALPGALPQILSLQQIAQNASYRTNVGLAEAAGLPVQAVLTVFNASGAKLTEIPVQLAAGEQRQMNQLLAQHGIELADGRIEVKVTGGEGKVTAYASVVDSGTQDPLLVSGELLAGAGSRKYVLPGVANLFTGIADWRTDVRIFNYGTMSQPATLIFFPFNNGPSKSVTVSLEAGRILTLDNVLKSQFDAENTGGVLHLTTPQPASLVVTGRTYNQTASGTFGQFVPAVTAAQAVGATDGTLHILQVEDSSRYRTNVGIAEVSGLPAVVELQIILPDSKITPTVQIPLAANEFRQFNPIRELGLGNVYNARITVRVLSGQGRVTAYGSVIDELTQDPTYVPAQ